jgi:hypothetical protein
MTAGKKQRENVQKSSGRFNYCRKQRSGCGAHLARLHSGMLVLNVQLNLVGPHCHHHTHGMSRVKSPFNPDTDYLDV